MDVNERYLAGAHAVVTGASRGIGAAVAEALAMRGAKVTLMARHPDALRGQEEAMQRAGGDAHHVVCDVTQQRSVTQAFAAAVERNGPVAVLVNNAGTAESALALETDAELWARMIAVNLTGTYACSMQVLAGMLDAKQGRIVNVASTAGLRGYKTMTAYCAAKHGVVGYTRALALETAKHGITVNAVCPGYTDTELTDGAVANLVTALGRTPAEAREMLVRTIPRGRLTTPAEVASAVSWLCSPGAAAVTGIALGIAGGEVA